MLLSTTETINRDYDIIGLVFGNAVQSKNVFKDIGAQFKSVVGGQLGSYQKLLSESRQIALNELIKNAEALSADAIISIKQSTSAIQPGASEVMFVGTAIKFK